MASERNTPCRLGAICGAVSVKRMHIGTMRNSSLRVAWVLYGLPGGGVGTVCLNAVEAIARTTRHEVSLVCTHRCSRGFVPPNGVGFYFLGLSDSLDACCRTFHAWLEDNPQDVIVLNDNSMLEPYLPYLPPETASVVVVHDDAYRHLSGIKRFYRHLDGVVAVSRYVERLVRKEVPDYAGLLTTVHNGCAFPPCPERMRKDGPLSLLFVGRIDYLVKGAGDIPRIMRRLSKRGFSGSLTVVGGEDDALQRQLSLSCSGVNVCWLGRVAREECLRIASMHDVLLVPSRKEPFGMVTVEGMGMGCVPVAYDIESGSREIIEHAINGFLIPFGDYDAFADAIIRLDEDRKKLHQMACAAIRWARSQFSAERMAKDYVTLLSKIATIPPSDRVRLPFDLFQPRATRRSFYQMLPSSFRRALRRWVGKSAKLSYILRRY